jgi:hypothetical protein
MRIGQKAIKPAGLAVFDSRPGVWLQLKQEQSVHQFISLKEVRLAKLNPGGLEVFEATLF